MELSRMGLRESKGLWETRCTVARNQVHSGWKPEPWTLPLKAK